MQAPHDYDEYVQRQQGSRTQAVQPMPVTNSIKIKLLFDYGPCRGKEYGIDVEKNTTIEVLKSYIKRQLATICQIPDNTDIQLQLYGIPQTILHNNDNVLTLSRSVLDNPKPTKCDIAFEVKLTQFGDVKEYDGGRKSRAKPLRRNSKKNKRTRRKSVKKQQQHRRK